MRDKNIDLTIFINEDDRCAVYLNKQRINNIKPTDNAKILYMGGIKLKQVLEALEIKNDRQKSNSR